MAGTITGIAIGGLISGISTKFLLASMNEIEAVNEKKQKIIHDTIKSDDLKLQLEGKKCMISIKNMQRAGILEILQKKIYVNERLIIDSSGIKKIEIDRSINWEKCKREAVNLNMGLNWFVPPNIENVVTHCESSISINAKNNKALSEAIENIYGIKYVFPANDQFIANFLSLEGKEVFAYGSVIKENNGTKNNKFKAEFMGLSQKTLANKIFEKEQLEIDQKFAFSTIGLVSGVVVILVSSFK